LLLISQDRNETPGIFGKQETLCNMPLDEYKLMTSTQQFAFGKVMEAE
jgi:hypothetical protein